MKCVLLAVLLVGCRTQPLVSAPDLGPLSFDLARQVLSCAGLAECYHACGSDDCPIDCFNRASADARRLVSDVETCIGNWCFRPDGDRPPRCIAGLGDPPGAPEGVCRRCVESVGSGWDRIEPCDPEDPDCHPEECQRYVDGCFAD